MSIKAQVVKGTRDFLPLEVKRRNYFFDIIREVFETFGYFAIETPSFESLETLTGKYGEEGDRLLFKILNSGDYLSKAEDSLLAQKDSNALIPQIAKKGLRYDLTVPFARFVVQHENELNFPFKRYQIQPVWRADRPQKGRYQEFYQCDVDVIGSDSLMYEAELIQVYDQVFHQLGLEVEIVLNNRKILAGIAEVNGITERFNEMTVAIDKLDKIGHEGVIAEMVDRGIGIDASKAILDTLNIQDRNVLRYRLDTSETGRLGIREIEEVYAFLGGMSLHNNLVFDPSLARGLNYYTGCIFEVKAVNGDIGSLGGGGRYAELTGVFGRSGMSGVGVSFGAERIYDLMLEQSLFPADLNAVINVLFVAFDQTTHKYAFKLVSTLREKGIKADLYPEPAKMKKQMKYANAIGVPFVAVIGEEEMENQKITLKNMRKGEQEMISFQMLMERLGKSPG
jgi:histidyl-tRNA synthetase